MSQKVTLEEQLEGKEKPTTQFGRIMDFLGIEMFPASSSQAKGRIERLWGTLQDRLITEFKINDVHTIEQANDFLPKYIKKHKTNFLKRIFQNLIKNLLLMLLRLKANLFLFLVMSI